MPIAPYNKVCVLVHIIFDGKYGLDVVWLLLKKSGKLTQGTNTLSAFFHKLRPGKNP